MSSLLPQQTKKANLQLYRKRFLTLVFLLAGVCAIAGSVLLLPSLVLVKNKVAVLTEKKNILSRRETNELQKTLQDVTKDINTKLALFSETDPLSPVIKNEIDPILKTQGSSIKISSLLFTVKDTDKTQRTVRIIGTAATRESLLAFADGLRTIDGFSDVTLPIDTFIKDTNIGFTLTAVVTVK